MSMIRADISTVVEWVVEEWRVEEEESRLWMDDDEEFVKVVDACADVDVVAVTGGMRTGGVGVEGLFPNSDAKGLGVLDAAAVVVVCVVPFDTLATIVVESSRTELGRGGGDNAIHPELISIERYVDLDK